MTADKTNKDENLNVLALEDSARDFELIKALLIDAGYQLRIKRVETEDMFTASLCDKAWDIILADFNLPGFDAFSALRIRNEICPDTPFICVSGAIGEESAIELLKSGAMDYVIKDRPGRLPFAVGRALDEARGKKIHKQNNEALKEMYRQLKESQRATLGILEDLNAEIRGRQAKEVELRETMDGVIRLVVRTVESRDPYTAGHQRRVAELANAMAEKMGFPQDRIKGVRMAGEIHDLGKISVPVEILSKPTRLIDPEFELIKIHSKTGYDILKGIEFPWPIAEAVFQHHERMDGSGYPRGLQGEGILPEARILAVADVIEAMASHRPYRAAIGLDKAMIEIEMNRGVLYDPATVDACLRLFREEGYQFQLAN